MDSKAALISSSSPLLCLELYVPSITAEPETFRPQSCHTGENVPHYYLVMVVMICLHNQQSNNLHEEQQQNTGWGALSSDVYCFTAFPFEGPVKVCTTYTRG